MNSKENDSKVYGHHIATWCIGRHQSVIQQKKIPLCPKTQMANSLSSWF